MGHLDKLFAPTVEAMGYDVVRVLLVGSGRAATLQVMAERQDGAPMTVSDCERISRALSALLDVEDPIAGAYLLEVSSPGLDRPLTRVRDYENFVGREARIETDRLVGGQRRFKGTLAGIDDQRQVRLHLDDIPEGEDPVRLIPFGAIVKARLLLTDALIAETLKAAKAEEALLDPPDAEDGDGDDDRTPP